MGSIPKKWLWLLLWTISIVLVLTVPGDLWWARVLIIAPAMAGLVLMVLATLKKDQWRS
jgi:hypothetical protein